MERDLQGTASEGQIVLVGVVPLFDHPLDRRF
jgi:hypothetical protein